MPRRNARARVFPVSVRNGRARKVTCEACRKTAYVSIEVAEGAAKEIVRADGPQMRAYEGDCGWIHLTSKVGS